MKNNLARTIAFFASLSVGVALCITLFVLKKHALIDKNVYTTIAIFAPIWCCAPAIRNLAFPNPSRDGFFMNILAGYVLVAASIIDICIISFSSPDMVVFLVWNIIFILLFLVLLQAYHINTNNEKFKRLHFFKNNANIRKRKHKFLRWCFNFKFISIKKKIYYTSIVLLVILFGLTAPIQSLRTDKTNTTTTKTQNYNHSSESSGNKTVDTTKPQKYPSRTVYVSKYKLIHSNTNCSGLKYYTTMKLEQAEREHCKYCSKCW